MGFAIHLLVITSIYTVANCEWNGAKYIPNQLTKLPGYGDDWIYIPDENGDPQKVYLTSDLGENDNILNQTTQLANRFFLQRKTNLTNFVTFDLYTKKHPDTHFQLILDDPQRLKDSGIDFTKNIKLITHGWLSSNKSSVCQNIKNRYLDKKNVNVIVVDWAPLAKNPTYVTSTLNTKKVGKYVGKFIQFLVDNGGKLSKIHLIGHSLGAHVCGFAGAGIRNGRVGRITGLDPASPLFQFLRGNNRRLDASDAVFVDVIHTCGGALGYSSSIGTADFYPNGGTPSQPGCTGITALIESCSHGRANDYFEESIGNPGAFPSVYCHSWNKFKSGECDDEKEIPMGEETPSTAHGDYYLFTSENTPFRAIKFDEDYKPVDSIEEEDEVEEEEEVTTTESTRKGFRIPFIGKLFNIGR